MQIFWRTIGVSGSLLFLHSWAVTDLPPDCNPFTTVKDVSAGDEDGT